MAYTQTGNGSGQAALQVTNSTDGIHWIAPYSCTLPGAHSVDASPSIAYFGGYVVVAIRDHVTDAMVTCKIIPGQTGITVTEYAGITLNFNPSLASFNGKLYAAMEGINTSHTLYVYTSTDGITFTLLSPGPSSDQTSRAPTLAVHNNILYLGFEENDSSDELLYRYSTDGVTFAPAINAGTQVGGPPLFVDAPNLPGSPYNGQLFLYFASFAPTYLCSNHGH
jgi:hypothetical protein